MNNGFLYTRNDSYNGTIYWKCEQNDECHGRINGKNGQITKRKDHSHAPDRSVGIVQDARSNMKENIKDTRQCTSGCHRRFSTIVGYPHPNIFDCIGCLEKSSPEQAKLLMGEAPQAVKKASKKKNVRVKRIVQKFDERNP